MALQVKTRHWGNSIGIIIPSETVEKLKIKPDEDVIIEITKKEHILKELWGAFEFKKPGRLLIKEVRKDLESKWLK